MSFHIYKQRDEMDCGPTCLRIVAKQYHRNISIHTLREKCNTSREGVTILNLSNAAESIGFRTIITKSTLKNLNEVTLPVIVHWKKRHFVVVHEIKKTKVLVADPAFGLIKYSHSEFEKGFISDTDNKGTTLHLEPGPKFYENQSSKEKLNLKYFASYFLPYKKLYYQALFGGLATLILQFILPFLTQSIVDVGITNQDISFINLILIAQLVLFGSRVLMEFVRSWVFLHISTKLNLAILTDFLIKLLSLPIAFFNRKTVGDIFQRIGDHSRLESFISSATVGSIFSFLNLLVFGIILAYYNLQIFLVFLVSSILYVGWLIPFMNKRRLLDYKLFDNRSESQTTLLQLIHGVQEIKLYNLEKEKRWQWERTQIDLYKNNRIRLALSQYQQIGAVFINELKNIIIIFLSAKLVIEGQITLGMMISIQYMNGQLNLPISQLISLLHSFQDAKMSMERLSEIHDLESENMSPNKADYLEGSQTIRFSNVHFSFDINNPNAVLKGLDFSIPHSKITAIVGGSGSGKTTLLKLLLRFYEPNSGEIFVGETPLKKIDIKVWRDKCGAVLQDSFIFSDTIARNVYFTDDFIDVERLKIALNLSNCQEFVSSLPLSYNTKIGASGHMLSPGQRQRLLIARLIFKDPDFVFLDEATNSLDSLNEEVIIQNLTNRFKGKTMIIVAHRLSTIKHADQIVVLDRGEIAEIGTHQELINNKSTYWRLFNSQLVS